MKNLTSDLIYKWKKISKEAAESKTLKASSEIESKPTDKVTISQEIKAESSNKIDSNPVNKTNLFYEYHL